MHTLDKSKTATADSRTCQLMDQLFTSHYERPLEVLMEIAGLKIAEICRHILGDLRNKRILIAAGKGHNGGDSLVAARYLNSWQAKPILLLADKPERLKSLTFTQFKYLRHENLTYQVYNHAEFPDSDPDLVIDGLLGFGISSSPKPPLASLINDLNTLNGHKLAIDTPSGLDVDTGKIFTPCFRADTTCALAVLKPAFKTAEAEKVLGRLYLADIGVPKALYSKLGIHPPPVFNKASIVEIR